jgi:outer membrane cobalamin receptor
VTIINIFSNNYNDLIHNLSHCNIYNIDVIIISSVELCWETDIKVGETCSFSCLLTKDIDEVYFAKKL